MNASGAADGLSMPEWLRQPLQMVYRSGGLGVYAVGVRYVTMPMEKVAMIANSAQVTAGKNQLGQAWKITFREGAFAPYRTVGGASIVAWFLQYGAVSAAEVPSSAPTRLGRHLVEAMTRAPT